MISDLSKVGNGRTINKKSNPLRIAFIIFKEKISLSFLLNLLQQELQEFLQL